MICREFVVIDDPEIGGTGKIAFTGSDGEYDDGDWIRDYEQVEIYSTYEEASERAPEILVEEYWKRLCQEGDMEACERYNELVNNN